MPGCASQAIAATEYSDSPTGRGRVGLKWPAGEMFRAPKTDEEASMSKRFAVAVSLMVLTLPPLAESSPIVFEVGGTDAASIQATVDTFRAALGSPNNGNASGPLTSGRREINWDGGGSTANSPGSVPFNAFLNARGMQLATPGTGFVQSPASASGTDPDLGTFFGNATYDDTFAAFSAARLFVPVGSNITDGLFFVPGTAGLVPATVGGFGAVFSDVDLANSTSIAFFDNLGNLLYEDYVPAATVGDKGLSFLGVIFNAGERISRVRITSGSGLLGSASNDVPAAGNDLVAMDDFLYSEPLPLPEPGSLTLSGAALVALLSSLRRRRGRQGRASMG